MNRRKSFPRGFTLVELLVVIGIIAVLIGILLPALGKAREQAKKAQCLSNLKQMAAAAANYATANKGAFPYHSAHNDPSTTWDDLVVSNPLNGITNNNTYVPNWLGGIWKYLGESARTMQCPAAPEAAEIPAMNDTWTQANRTYICNGVVTHRSGKGIKRPSEVCTFKDDGSKNATTAATVRPRWNTVNHPVPKDGVLGFSGWMYFAATSDLNAGLSGKLTDKWHGNGQCLAFLDGHAEYRRWEDITCKTYGLKPKDLGRGTLQLYEAPDPKNPTIGGYTDSVRMFERATD